MKVYVVIIDSGEWDDHRQYVDSICATREKAEKERDLIKMNFQSIKAIPCPVGEDIEKLNGKEFDRWMKWSEKRNEALDFNRVLIKEFKLK